MKQTAIFILICALYGCNTCRNIPAYGGRAPMAYGKPKELFEMRAKRNPYHVKAKKPKTAFINRYK